VWEGEGGNFCSLTEIANSFCVSSLLQITTIFCSLNLHSGRLQLQ
jgi:hypothetical protein